MFILFEGKLQDFCNSSYCLYVNIFYDVDLLKVQLQSSFVAVLSVVLSNWRASFCATQSKFKFMCVLLLF
jgi:hypothetical protein